MIPLRLGLYIDGAFRRGSSEGGERIFTGTELFGFLRFASAVGGRFERFALIARETGDAADTALPLPAAVDLVSLPYYPSLRRLGRVIAALPGTIAAMWRGLADLDVVWVTGVHPFGLLLALLAKLRRRRVVLLIRQDSPSYFRARLPGPRWRPLLLPLRLLDWGFRALGRRLPTTVVGADLARRYRAPRPNVLSMHVTLLESSQLAAAPRSTDWSREVALLTVGRVDTEKNPALAAQALADLDRGGPARYRLTWVGEGPLSEELRARASQLGVPDRLVLAGFVPFGPELLRYYRDADAFVHTAVTEGVPGVLYEAMGAGLPIVATDVGGVAEALAGGEAGLLVPPGDAAALSGAIRSLAADPELRARLAGRALELARDATIEAESARVAEFIAGEGGG